MARVLVTPYLLRNAAGPYKDVLEGAGFEVVWPRATLSESHPENEKLLAELQGIDAVLAGSERYTGEVLAGSQLRAIARMGVGYDAIDMAAATQRGVVVTITPGANEPSVAETTLALLLGVYRGFSARDREARSGIWTRKVLPRLAGRTLGLVGLGRIGKAVVPRAQGLGLRVIAHDVQPDQAFAQAHGVRLCSFDDLLAEADIVSLHTPCTPQTRHLINRQTLARMKKGAVLINTARGGLVDEQALVEALQSGHLFAAGLDVFEVEPLPADSPLAQLDNVLLSPHVGGLDHESQLAMSVMAAQSLVDLYQGRWPEGCVVNDGLRNGWRWKR
jgi:phosphoglycerate dehydrogenase-like enzyme